MGTLRYMLKENASKKVSDPKALSQCVGGLLAWELGKLLHPGPAEEL